MPKVPFKVSARTARLIGRENIATSKGAIIELVKNSADADSGVSLIYFDNKYAELPNSITKDEYDWIISNNISAELINECFAPREEVFALMHNVDQESLHSLKKQLQSLSCLYIIDAGDGMTQKIIRDHWMTIGTDNKAYDIFTKSGRVKAGAKGIGRFALDKLGDTCEMITKFNPDVHIDIDESGSRTNFVGYRWFVDWRQFEGVSKTIDSVEADLNGLQDLDLASEVRKSCHAHDIESLIQEYGFRSGTILKIANLRDDWDDFIIGQLFSDLEVLVPADEFEDFKIYLLSSSYRDKYGLVEGSVCDDFDYKIIAEADDDQNIHIIVFRNEYDVDIIDPNLFRRDAMKVYPFTKDDFKEGVWQTHRTFSQLIPGFKGIDEDNVFEKIGSFKFSFYFMKRTYSTTDLEKFNYKKFSSHERRDWLNKYGGIKLFRDKFRVRPYGETNSSAFDWLGLGTRKSKSPAAVSKFEGGYKVEPENVAGAISISRVANIDFEDKSSREGLQENKTFQIFRQLIIAIIGILEEDRSYIAREMLRLFNENNSELKNRQDAERLAQAILERRQKDYEELKTKEIDPKNKDSDNNGDGSSSQPSNELIILAELNKEKTEIIEKLEDEQKVLRGLASSGIVIASFTHELGHLNDLMGSRIEDLQFLLKDKVSADDFKDQPAFLNPFIYLENMKKQDLKMQNWLKFALGAARKDKRKRKIIYFSSYFEGLIETWKSVLDNRQISFTINYPNKEEVSLRIFEIDLDSIFNNLIVNSIDAFLLHKEIVNRAIIINLTNSEREVQIDYLDNGPGLSDDIEKPEKIFDALFTTKRNKHTGEEEGTGLGMWLLSSIVKDNDGTKKLLFPEKGFGLRLTFLKKYLRS